MSIIITAAISLFLSVIPPDHPPNCPTGAADECSVVKFEITAPLYAGCVKLQDGFYRCEGPDMEELYTNVPKALTPEEEKRFAAERARAGDKRRKALDEMHESYVERKRKQMLADTIKQMLEQVGKQIAWTDMLSAEFETFIATAPYAFPGRNEAIKVARNEIKKLERLRSDLVKTRQAIVDLKHP